MDIRTILPLLMKNKSTEKVMPIINAMSGESAQSASNEELLSKLVGANGSKIPPELLGEMLKNRKVVKNNIAGITPILGVVNDDILGKMVKYLSKN